MQCSVMEGHDSQNRQLQKQRDHLPKERKIVYTVDQKK